MYKAKPGERCKYSSTFSGIVPVKYLGRRDWGKGLFKKYNIPVFEVTQDTGSYKKGYQITEKIFVTPNKCFHKTGMFTYVSSPHEWV